MLNPYCRRTKIQTPKFRGIIRYFCTDLEATKTALLAGVERKNINLLFQKFRQRIAPLAEQESPFATGEIEIDEADFGARRARGKRGRGALGKTIVFGMKKRVDKVYTQVVKTGWGGLSASPPN
ncbi:hypothetical protein FACS1894139_19070 [Planctomycetales bacterium]|nr:hypothetical protein FACS1894107_04680 [Planctomycetales bacterium]GHS98883.1 hypothetical protein FACS1894108_07830 [Planctomycetales bacterium]GHT08972.1 hypothetical protein FACS1894139_19070 [Planctomycetales bacterium]